MMLVILFTGVMALVGGGLIDVAGGVLYEEFLFRVADSGAHVASSQSIMGPGGVVVVDQAGGSRLGNAVLGAWIGNNGITSAGVSIANEAATATVTGVYRPPVLGGLPGFGGFTLTARRTSLALPTG